MSARLTILLPLKGRHLHTLRFFWHAERCRLPYHFLVADGQVHPVIARLLENPSVAFPHLDIEYVRYPDDASFAQFFRKMADASARVRTPYVMQADNDDFLLCCGLDWCMDFLDAHQNYASCGGGIGGFSLGASSQAAMAGVTGSVEHLAFRYGPHYEPRELSAPSAAQRIRDCSVQFGPLYYNVYRAEVLATVSAECVEIDFSDLELHETFFSMRALSCGAARSEGTVLSYLRQMGMSLQSSYQGEDWVGHLLRSRFTSDFDAMATRIAAAVARADGTDPREFVDEIREVYGNKLRGDLRHRYRSDPPARARYHPLSLIKRVLQRLSLDWLLRLYRDAAERRYAARKAGPGIDREREMFFERLRACGATDDYQARFRQELATAEDAVGEAEFTAFVRHHAPEFLADAVAGGTPRRQEVAA